MTSPLEVNLKDIQVRVNSAAKSAARNPAEISILAVSKKQPLELMLEYQKMVTQSGQKAFFGENYVQEFKKKRGALVPGFEAHLIGPLQSNKVKDACRLFDCIQSVHSLEIAKSINHEAQKLQKIQNIFLQVNVSDDEAKSGFDSAQVLALAEEELPKLQALRLSGVMTITKLYQQPELARADFRKLKTLRDQLQQLPGRKNQPLALSMGMSADFEVAIEEGSGLQFVRIGTALFGERG